MEIAIVRHGDKEWEEYGDFYHHMEEDRKRTLCDREIYEIGDSQGYPGYQMCKTCDREWMKRYPS